MCKGLAATALLVTLLPIGMAAEDAKGVIEQTSRALGAGGLNSIIYSGAAAQGNFGRASHFRLAWPPRPSGITRAPSTSPRQPPVPRVKRCHPQLRVVRRRSQASSTRASRQTTRPGRSSSKSGRRRGAFCGAPPPTMRRCVLERLTALRTRR